MVGERGEVKMVVYGDRKKWHVRIRVLRAKFWMDMRVVVSVSEAGRNDVMSGSTFFFAFSVLLLLFVLMLVVVEVEFWVMLLVMIM